MLDAMARDALQEGGGRKWVLLYFFFPFPFNVVGDNRKRSWKRDIGELVFGRKSDCGGNGENPIQTTFLNA